MQPLTPRQHQILTFIANYIEVCGRAPLLREISAGFGLRSPATARAALIHLERKGYVARRAGFRGVSVLRLPPTSPAEGATA